MDAQERAAYTLGNLDSAACLGFHVLGVNQGSGFALYNTMSAVPSSTARPVESLRAVRASLAALDMLLLEWEKDLDIMTENCRQMTILVHHWHHSHSPRLSNINGNQAENHLKRPF